MRAIWSNGPFWRHWLQFGVKLCGVLGNTLCELLYEGNIVHHIFVAVYVASQNSGQVKICVCGVYSKLFFIEGFAVRLFVPGADWMPFVNSCLIVPANADNWLKLCQFLFGGACLNRRLGVNRAGQFKH